MTALTLEDRGVREYVRTGDLAYTIRAWLADHPHSTYHDLADLAGVSPRAVNKILYNETEFQSFDLADRLMRAMNRNVIELKTVLRRRHDPQRKTPRSARQDLPAHAPIPAPAPAGAGAGVCAGGRCRLPRADVRTFSRLTDADAHPAEANIAALREHPAVQLLAAELAEHGHGLRLVPAQLRPDLPDGAGGCWTWDGDSHGQVINIAVSERSDPSDIVYDAAAALAGCCGAAGRDAPEPVREVMSVRFALTLVRELFDEMTVTRHARALITQITDAQLHGALRCDQAACRYALRAWATLEPLSAPQRTFFEQQLAGRSQPVHAAYQNITGALAQHADTDLDPQQIRQLLTAQLPAAVPQLTRAQDPTGRQTAILKIMASHPHMAVTYQWMHQQLTADGHVIPRPDSVRILLRRMAQRGHIRQLPGCRWKLNDRASQPAATAHEIPGP